MFKEKQEGELREPIRQWILSKNLVVSEEITKIGKFPDLIGINGTSIEIAVELKVSDWKKALYQAIHYNLFARKSYIAMPEKKRALLLKNLAEFKRWNVGILLVGEKVEVLCEG